MSIDPTGAAAPGIGSDSGQQSLGPDCDDVHDPTSIAVVPKAQSPVVTAATAAKPTGLHSPPDSNNVDGSTDSELSDFDEDIANADDIRLYSPQLPTAAASDAGHSQPSPTSSAAAAAATANTTAATSPPAPEQVPTPEQDEDIGEVLPDHWSGTVPVFRPTMDQFKDFKKFMNAVDSYGMKSGIIKIIPPDEWKNSLPPLDDLVKQVRVREPIKQDIMGSNGTYRQVNILHQRSYNVPQWRQLCDQSEHQPPARRGERRANADKPKPVTRTRAAAATASKPNTAPTSNAPTSRRSTRGRRGRGGGRGGARGRPRKTVKEEDTDVDDRPMTPESPNHVEDAKQDGVVDSIEQDPGVKEEEADCKEQTPTPRRMGGFSRQAKPKVQSTSARRKFSKREGSAMIDEEAFKDFDYKMDISDYTPERCEELERIYWKTLTYATPLYGADLMGTLFHEDTELWNLNKLPNLLDVLGTKVPGVNTAYLYLGMWKATFAWHLEDVDLYSINYLHFGAPKQWYSISQADARRFEAAMKSIWPTDAKACDQFLRHKAFLISPSHLQQHYNIKVNKCLSYPGEFVVTYPYGYHSGYNLGYNCAEAVNFALDSWLPMGKIAKKCDCAQAQDSVWVDVYEIERKLRGEPTPEIWDSDEDDEDEDSDEEDSDEEDEPGLPSPRSGHAVRVKISTKKRKRVRTVKEKKEKVKKLRLRVKAHVEPPCCLCPNDVPGCDLLATDDGRKVHRLCALYLPETYIETVDGNEVVFNLSGIEKARLELKCLFCRSKRGACFQCSQKKCPRSYHATCAAAAGVFVEEGDVPVFDKDGVEYKEQAFEFSCRFHRTKRDKHLDGEALEDNARVRKAASALTPGEICQMQFYKKDIFAGIVVENRHDEHTLLLDILPNGARTEVEWKWLLVPDPADYHLPKASPNALPMPTSRKAKEEINAKRSTEEPPRTGDMFVEGLAPGKDYSWAEFHTCEYNQCKNGAQVKLDLSKEDQVWHYLGQTSTEAKAQYTEDTRKPQHNVKSNFLDSIPKPPPPPRPQYHHTSYGATHPTQARQPALLKSEKPYVYKPRKPVDMSLVPPFGGQIPPSNTLGLNGAPPLPFGTDPRFANTGVASVNHATWMASGAQPQVSIQSSQPNVQQVSHHVNSRFTPVPLPPSPFSAPAWRPSPHQQTPHQIPMPPQMQHAPQQYTPSPAPIQRPNGPESQIAGSVQHPVQPPSHVPQPSPLPIPPQHTWQKFRYFQSHHNRETSRYRTPYAPWGGFTNGYEGDLRKHLMKKPDAVPFSHNRRLSFNLGGGLQGLTRPPSHSYSNSVSSGTSPRNGAASPTSSAASVMSPPSQPIRGFGHQRTSSVPTTTSHPAMRTQASSSSQLTYHGDLAGQGASCAPNGATTPQQGCQPVEGQRRGSLPAISPAGIPSQQPTFLNTALPHTAQPCSGGPIAIPMEVDSETQESPAQQLKQQLRRISDAKESPFRVPGSRSRSHTPRSSLNQLPRLRTPSQPDLSFTGMKQERRPSESQATTPMELAANGVAVKEFPVAEASAANNQGLVEKLMLDLRRASMQSQGIDGGSMDGLGGFAANP